MMSTITVYITIVINTTMKKTTKQLQPRLLHTNKNDVDDDDDGDDDDDPNDGNDYYVLLLLE